MDPVSAILALSVIAAIATRNPSNMWNNQFPRKDAFLMSDFRRDYWVLVSDILEYQYEKNTSNVKAGSLIVPVEYIELNSAIGKALCKEALEWEPDWDRYWPEGIQALVEQGKLPSSALETGDVPNDIDPWKLGFKRYIENMRKSMGKDPKLPPILVDENYQLLDGRHRLLASCGYRDFVPVLKITDLNIEQ
jgi:hypothetical protein